MDTITPTTPSAKDFLGKLLNVGLDWGATQFSKNVNKGYDGSGVAKQLAKEQKKNPIAPVAKPDNTKWFIIGGIAAFVILLVVLLRK